MVETVSLTLLALAALWLFRGDRGRSTAAPAGGRAPVPRGCRCGSRLAAAARSAVVGWGLAALLLLPHLTLLLVSFVPVGTWTTEPFPPAYTLRNYLTLVQDPVRARPLLNSLWLATVATRRGRGDRAARALLVAPGAASAAGGLIEALLALPWAVPGHGVRDRAGHRVQRAGALGRPRRAGRHALDPSARVSRTESADHQPRHPGRRPRPRSLARRGGRHARGRPLARPCAGSRCRSSGRRSLAGASLAFVTAFGDFVTSIMLYTYDTRPISLEILSSLRQSDVGRRGGLRRGADAGERRGLRRSGADRGGAG